MVLDSSGVAHAGSADDDLRFIVVIDRDRFLLRNRKVQVRERNRVDAGIDHFHGILVKTAPPALLKHTRCLDGHRTVDINREVRQLRNHVVHFNLPDKIQYNLCPSDRKRGNYKIPPS